MQTTEAVPRTLREIDWDTWVPRDRAVLLFVIRATDNGEQVLLIRKKRGLGAGKINAPGGRVDAGETPAQAAIREVQEEVGVTPTGITPHGEIRFQFVDGYSIHVWVFRATDCIGEPYETAEATPYWLETSSLPYHEMWEDDRHWLPHILERRTIQAWYVFDGEAMLDQRLEVQPAPNTP